MIETILYSIFLGFISSRAAKMAYDFMCYGEILGWFKLAIARKLFPGSVQLYEDEMKHMTKTDAQEKSLHMYNLIANQSFWISLLDCVFCLTVWASILAALIGIAYGLRPECLLFIPIFGYLITEKL